MDACTSSGSITPVLLGTIIAYTFAFPAKSSAARFTADAYFSEAACTKL